MIKFWVKFPIIMDNFYLNLYSTIHVHILPNLYKFVIILLEMNQYFEIIYNIHLILILIHIMYQGREYLRNLIIYFLDVIYMNLLYMYLNNIFDYFLLLYDIYEQYNFRFYAIQMILYNFHNRFLL